MIMEKEELIKLRVDLEKFKKCYEHYASKSEELAFEVLFMAIKRKIILIEWN